MESTSLITKGMGVEIFPGYETSVSCEPMLDGNIYRRINQRNYSLFPNGGNEIYPLCSPGIYQGKYR